MKNSFLIRSFRLIFCIIAFYNNTNAIEPATKELWHNYWLNNAECVFSHDCKFVYVTYNGVKKFDAMTGEFLDSLDILPLPSDNMQYSLNILPGDSVLALLYKHPYKDSYGYVSFYNMNSKTWTYVDTLKNGNYDIFFNKDYSKFVTFNNPSKKFEVYSTKNLQKLTTGAFFNAENLVGWLSDSTILAILWDTDHNNMIMETYNTNTGAYITGVTSKRKTASMLYPSISPDGNFIILPFTYNWSYGLYRANDLEMIKEISISSASSNTIFDKTSRYIFLYYNGNNDIYDILAGKVIYKFNKSVNIKAISDSNNLIYTISGEMYKLDWNQIVSVEESEIIEKLYPNPCDDYISIQVENDTSFVEFFNIIGESIKTISINDKIDVSDLQSGIYFVKIGDKVTKFIKR